MAFPVSAQKNDELTARMAALGVRETDIDETFVRGSGPGGQHVNKTATCVMLAHRPSGISVRCQASRSQGLNRFYARRLLLDKIEGQQLGKASAEQQAIEKIRRQKRKRSKRAKAKMLADKRQQAEKKATRGRVRPNHD
ncbi:MAG: peptide chain release factor family protein [Nitrospirota bacterium]